MKQFIDAVSEVDNIILTIEIHTDGTEDDCAETYNRYLENAMCYDGDLEVHEGDEADNFIDMTNEDDVFLLIRLLKRTALYLSRIGESTNKVMNVLKLVEGYTQNNMVIDIEETFID